MSPQKAEAFYKNWKKMSNFKSPSKPNSVRAVFDQESLPLGLSDQEKGLERIGR